MLRDFIKVKGGFVKAVKIVDDLHSPTVNKDKVENYFVNPSALAAFYSIAKGLHPSARQRVHLISGTYGSGKSHLGLVLANYLTRRSSSSEFEMIFRRIAQRDQHRASEIRDVRDSDRPFLLVLLEGADPDGAEHSLLIGFRRALREGGLAEDTLHTSYEIALGKVGEWKRERPEFAERLESLLGDDGKDLAWLESALSAYDRDAYQTFKRLHKVITTGEFFPEFSETTVDLCQRLSRLLCEKHNRCGIAVIWDQFNDHLQTTSLANLPREADFLRRIAEAAERSGESQMQLILISHHLPHAYLQALGVSKGALDSWKTVEGRFSEHHITAVDDAEEFLRDAITKTPDAEEWKAVCEAIERDTVTLDRIQELGFYPDKERHWLVETVCKGGYPLHPVAAYCLPRLSDVVGQEARTMFTFLEDSEKEGGLVRFMRESDAGESTLGLRLYHADRLFDYFDAAIRSPNDWNTRSIADDYDDAVAKVRDRRDALTSRVLKSITLLRTIERKYPSIPLLSTPAGLSLMLGAEEPEVSALLESLESTDVLWHQESSGAYDFRTGRLAGSFKDDFGKAVRELGATNTVYALQQRSPARDIRTRKYTDNHGVVVRILEGEYVRADDLANVSWREERIRREFRDGVVLRVIVESDEDLQNAKKAAVVIKNRQIVVAIPKRPLVLSGALRSLTALDGLRVRLAYAQEETQLHREWKHRYDSEKRAFDSEMAYWADVRNSTWYSGGQQLSGVGDEESGVADAVMARVFDKTPRFEHSRVANYPRETDQRGDRIKLNTMILDPFKTTVDVVTTGRGAPAEKAIIEGILDPQGMLKKKEEGNSVCYHVGEPTTEPAKAIWSLVRMRLTACGPTAEFERLVRELRLPPYGLSTGVVELFVAAFIRNTPNRFTIKTRKTKTAQLEARDLNGETIYDIVKDAGADKVTVEYREKLPWEDEYLATIGLCLSHVREVGPSPGLGEALDLLHDWSAQVPAVTWKAIDISERSKVALNLLAKCLGDDRSEDLLFRELPLLLGVEKELQYWEKGDAGQLTKVTAALEEVVSEIRGYPETVADRALDMLAKVFGAKRQTEYDISEKIKHWYSELHSAVKEGRLSPDADKLLKCSDIQPSDDIVQRFLVELPIHLGLRAYLDWEDVPSAIASYEGKLQAAKVEIEKRQKKVAPHKPVAELPENAKQLLESLRESIEKVRKRKPGVPISEVVRILDMLIADYRNRT